MGPLFFVIITQNARTVSLKFFDLIFFASTNPSSKPCGTSYSFTPLISSACLMNLGHTRSPCFSFQSNNWLHGLELTFFQKSLYRKPLNGKGFRFLKMVDCLFPKSAHIPVSRTSLCVQPLQLLMSLF